MHVWFEGTTALPVALARRRLALFSPCGPFGNVQL